MMKIQSSDFYSILPDSYKDIETQCISYALSRAVALICEKSQDAKVLAGIGNLSESILDYLAVELRAQYYTQDMNRAEKVGIVQSTLPWYLRAGTKYALEILLQTVYGGGEVTEWQEYAGQPYHFKVKVNSENNVFDGDDFSKRLMSLINGAKNLRYVLDSLGLICDIHTSESCAPFIGCAINQNVISSGANSNFIVVVGSDSLSTASSTIDGGTFTEPSDLVLNCGEF
jgi:P2-related tail formation protein